MNKRRDFMKKFFIYAISFFVVSGKHYNPLKKGKDLKEADFYKKHDLAG